MKKRFVQLRYMLILLIAFNFACQDNTPPPLKSSKHKSPKLVEKFDGTIVAMGNSLTAGYGLSEMEAYPYVLKKKLNASNLNFNVINAGISGETSSGALSRVDWILNLKPDIVILETGANDGFRGIKTTILESNLEQIISKFKANNTVVILCGMQMVRNLGSTYVTEFGNVYPRLAKKHNLIFMPFFLKDVATIPQLNLPDGIHPTPKGYQIIVDNIYPYVIKAIKHRKKRIENETPN